jgi:uncharacterized repeat protein (TIGR01451 family)
MKYFIVSIALCFILFSVSPVQAQTAQLKMGDYSLTAEVSPKKEAGTLGFLRAIFPKSAKSAKAFGLWYAQNENAMSDVVLEISDAATKGVLKNITAADLAGASKSETANKGARVISTYQFGIGADMLQLQITAESASDESAPLGKKMLLSYKLLLSKTSQVNAVIKFKTDGSAQKIGTAGFSATKLDNGQPAYPAIILTSLNPVNIDVAPRTGEIQQISVQAENIAVKEKTWVPLFSFEAAGTTVKDAGKSSEQASRIANRVQSKEAKPELAIFNTANPSSTVPGDTVTYTISYCNIGNALAQDAEITNPVPDGVMLLEKSVETKDAVVTIERKQAAAPESGVPSLVRWKITKKIMPGEEGILTMKVVVR